MIDGVAAVVGMNGDCGTISGFRLSPFGVRWFRRTRG